MTLFEQYVKLSNNLQYDAMIAAAWTILAAGGRHRRAQVGVEEKQNLSRLAPIEAVAHRDGARGRGGQAPGGSPIQSRVKKQMEKAQKETPREDEGYPARAGRKDEKGNEVDDLKKKIEQARIEETERKALEELKRLGDAPMSAEATVRATT